MLELMSARVGCALTLGTGWLQPVLMKADWPFARLSVTKKEMEVSLLFPAKSVRVPWTDIDEIRPGWTSITVKHHVAGEAHEFVLRAPMLWTRIQRCLQQHGISVPTN